MTRYRKTQLPPPSTVINFEGKGSKKTINYIWMPDKDGNLVKKDSAFVKKSFSKLSEKAQTALAQYIITVQNRQPTDAARKTVKTAAATVEKRREAWRVYEIKQRAWDRLSEDEWSFTDCENVGRS